MSTFTMAEFVAKKEEKNKPLPCTWNRHKWAGLSCTEDPAVMQQTCVFCKQKCVIAVDNGPEDEHEEE